MTNPAEKDIRQMAARWFPEGHDPKKIRIFRKVEDFFNIQFNDILILEKTAYLIRHNAKEGRFGIEEDVKFWVKRAIELGTGDMKVLKLAFHEKFKTSVGKIEFECFRSPAKEARILELVGDRENFMHGHSAKDTDGNLIRVLDFIHGKTIADTVEALPEDHETYFREKFPALFKNFIEAAKAIAFLHQNGEKHGDIRRDHIIVDRETGTWRWIDFDINYRHRENIYGYDLFGLGNLLIYLTGKGDVLIRDLMDSNHPVMEKLTQDDVNMVHRYRLANLKKIYDHIPEELNNILLHFSRGAHGFYDHTEQFIGQLERVKEKTK